MSLLQMSFYGSMMILAVIVLRSLCMNKLPKKTFTVLWDAVLIRLLIPFSLPSSFSVYSLIKQSSFSWNIENKAQSLSMPYIGSDVLPAVLNSETSDRVTYWDIYRIVWILGMVCFAAAFLCAYLVCIHKIRSSVPTDIDISDMKSVKMLKRKVTAGISPCFTSPLTYGVLKPVILFPSSFDFNNTKVLQYVLTHEYVHIRRFDSIRKLILIFTLCVHWFNPLVWAMYIIANQDIELSCDEEVIRLFGADSRKDYAKTLVSLEETKSNLPPTCTSFCRNPAEERIKSIMKYKKSTTIATASAIALTVFFCATFATSAAQLTPEQLSLDNYTQYDYSITDENGISASVSKDRINIAKRLTEDDCEFTVLHKDGCTSFSSGSMILPEGDAPKASTHSQAEMEQIIKDIESGKIPPLEIPDDPNTTVCFTDLDGNIIYDLCGTISSECHSHESNHHNQHHK